MTNNPGQTGSPSTGTTSPWQPPQKQDVLMDSISRMRRSLWKGLWVVTGLCIGTAAVIAWFALVIGLFKMSVLSGIVCLFVTAVIGVASVHYFKDN